MAVMLGVWGSGTAAADKVCTAAAGLSSEELAGCTCGDALAQLPLAAPSGMRLAAACNQRIEYGDWDGRFYFVGSHVEWGTVTREENEFFGDELRFAAEKSLPFKAFSSAAGDLTFRDDPRANRRFRAPRPTLKTSCWSARARIEVQSLYVLTGGSDESGNYPRKYRVLSVGKYRPCKTDP